MKIPLLMERTTEWKSLQTVVVSIKSNNCLVQFASHLPLCIPFILCKVEYLCGLAVWKQNELCMCATHFLS